jgi:hypothetical protein
MLFNSFSDFERIAAKGKPDNVLNIFITSYLQGEGLRNEYRATLDEETPFYEWEFQEWLDKKEKDEGFILPEVDVEGFRRENYAILRKGAYPPVEMYLDAVAKGDAVQEQEYKNLCLAVKERFPKKKNS